MRRIVFPLFHTIIKLALYIVCSKVTHLNDNNQILDIHTVYDHTISALKFILRNIVIIYIIICALLKYMDL